MNLVELKAIKQNLNSQLQVLNSIQVNCSSCQHLHTAKICEKFSAAPPADWLVGTVDCPDWAWDLIPF
jgi:hypothetical protein